MGRTLSESRCAAAPSAGQTRPAAPAGPVLAPRHRRVPHYGLWYRAERRPIHAAPSRSASASAIALAVAIDTRHNPAAPRRGHLADRRYRPHLPQRDAEDRWRSTSKCFQLSVISITSSFSSATSRGSDNGTTACRREPISRTSTVTRITKRAYRSKQQPSQTFRELFHAIHHPR